MPFTGYDTIAGAGGNGCTLHYVTNDAAIEEEWCDVAFVRARKLATTADVTRLAGQWQFSKEQKPFMNWS